MRKVTSARNFAAGLRGLKLTAICRTMLLRYPGNGNSIPSLRTLATSVPFPPVGPPPALGALLFTCLFGTARSGVARRTGFSAAVFGLGIVFVIASDGRGAVTGVAVF